MQIPVRRGGTKSTPGPVVAYAVVDPEDFDHLSQFRWHFSHDGYVRRTTPRENGVPGVVLMHREILGLVKCDPMQGDHINRDKLDNRRANLRVVTGAQNVQNVPARGGKSRHRGVSRRPSGRWAAQVGAAGRTHVLGTFDTEDEAAQAAAEGRKRLLPYSEEVASSR